MVAEQWPFDPELWSHKHGRAALTYEVAFGIFNGLISWLNGPFKATTHDRDIFVEDGGLADNMETWELGEVDLGYRHNDEKEDHDLRMNKLMYKTSSKKLIIGYICGRRVTP
jgi:hypothetical protein